jgi:hypothetical protein
VVWSRLWLLPDNARTELDAVRRSLDGAFSFELGLAVAAVLVWVPTRAGVFTGLIAAIFDLHRSKLYNKLRWPPQATLTEQRM